MDIKNKIIELGDKLYGEVVSIRRYLHAHPELSFKEYQTAKFIAKKLKQAGIPFRAEIAGTGIVAMITGNVLQEKCIALRADIDGLPIHETNNVDYRSQNKGVMHACGHDVHTACLLGAAMILKELKRELKGNIKLLFQPAEERLPGGASLMIKEGVMQNPDVHKIFGQHVYPELEAGKIGLKSGRYMASADEIYITVKGKGGHAALPEKAIDPVLITSHILIALQQIVSRNASPAMPTVLSFGKITADGATNIIPDKVKVEGTFRTFDEAWKKQAHRKMKSMAESIARGMGGDCEFDIREGYPYLINDPQTTARVKQLAVELLGEEKVIEIDLRMSSEDFAYYSQIAPACFYRLGVADPQQGTGPALHTASFDIDENALKTGMTLMAWIAYREANGI